jgi:hypothetical protein
MDPNDVLDILLVVSIAIGILLILISMAAAGRSAADLERQAERGVSGSPRIQAWVNLRTYLNRVAFGGVFVTINIMLVAGAPEVWRMWTFRTLWTVLLASYLLTSVLDWAAEREQVRLSMRELADERLAREKLADEAIERRADDATADQASYRQIAEEAVANLETMTNATRAAEGQPSLTVLAPVVPEHQSPTTPRQQAAADVATMRARLVAASLGLGISPKAPSEEKGE